MRCDTTNAGTLGGAPSEQCMSGRQADKAAKAASSASLSLIPGSLGSRCPVGLRPALGRLDSSMAESPAVSRMIRLLSGVSLLPSSILTAQLANLADAILVS